ncbi:MAG: hypothetical protein WCE54_23655 [Ignavibacteriaceae bacterium]
MARLSGSVLGNLSGKLGNLAARTKNGETILSARPSSFNASQNPTVVAIRQKFSVSVQIAKVVNGIDDLQTIWNKVRLPGNSVYNTIVQKNFPYSDVQRPTVQNIITPGGFNLVTSFSGVAADSIAIDLAALNTQANFSADEKDLSLSILLVGYDPANADDDYYKIWPFNYTNQDYVPANTLEVVVDLDQFHQTELARYTKKVLLVSAATKDANGKIIQYSSTFSNEF